MFKPKAQVEIPVKAPRKKDKEVEEPTEEVKEETEEEAEGKIWSVQSVTTETQPVIYNSETEKTYDLLSAIVEILNRTEE